jgi:glycosyltransferase involved in cell wall biosynthesis
MISTIKTHHEKIARIQVSHSEMHDVILETGIDPHKVFRIPIGINLGYFDWTTQKIRAKTRKILDIPQSSVVIGSFQKDGIGWGKGLEPKLIKGPDIFMSAIKTLKDQVPELYILLTGPARGYVKEGLKKLGIPYTHKVLKNYSDIGLYYNALDLYIVSSREEGGPKAVLESMASGIPLVTTRVGQAMDLVKHGENGWMVEPEDVEGLAYWIKYVIENHDSIHEVLKKGLEIANRNSYLAQTSLWKNFMEGFVSFN